MLSFKILRFASVRSASAAKNKLHGRRFESFNKNNGRDIQFFRSNSTSLRSKNAINENREGCNWNEKKTDQIFTKSSAFSSHFQWEQQRNDTESEKGSESEGKEVEISPKSRFYSIFGTGTLIASAPFFLPAIHSEEEKKKRERMEEEKRIQRENKLKEIPFNPFSYDRAFGISVLQKLEYIFGVLFLAPFRVLLLAPTISLLLLTSKIAVLGLKDSDHGVKLSWWRRFMWFQSRLLVRLTLFILGFYYVRTVGKLAKSNEAPIIVSNHISFIDPLLYFYQAFPCSVAKAEVGHTPFLGDVMKALCIMVDRSSKNSRENTLEAIATVAKRSYTNEFDRQVLIFPEGTTTNGNGVIAFKAGAFHPGLPVQPIALKYPHGHFNPAWVPAGPGLRGLILRMLCQFSNSVEIHFLDVYEPNEKEKKDPILYGKNVRARIARELGVPTTEHSYEDVILMTLAMKEHISSDEMAAFEFNKVRDLYHLDFAEAKTLLGRFAKMSRNGQMDYEGFCKNLKLPQCELTEQLFSVLDSDGKQTIDFREFATGLSIISHNTGVFTVAF
eukprot:TRINITY_DN4356_c0_g1_i3.p1 TRINITY_DN4356_c0_g1~~TRINITY_DN4356_c0_g1_i3.p1  ORF type:complete len:557 (+),score=121.33 TRINITY_DN4356_c0_g1_i3:487-2157(+)